jgi:hypothetical protein
MGWGNCGLDSKGRPIGYMYEGICDHPGCNKEIDRGLGYACGDMHGEDEVSCENYFCSEHLYFSDTPIGTRFLCEDCAKLMAEYMEEENED